MKIRQQGFSIIEMMVGLTIGLLGLLAVTQVMINFNKQRNTTTQTMEAQSNGTMALFLMERDLSQGGYGLMPLKNCQNFQWFWDPDAVPPSVTKPCEPTCGVQAPFTRGVAPVLITAHPGYSDELNIQYAQPKSGSPGSQVTQTQVVFTDPFKVSSTAGFAEGDLVVADVVNIVGGVNTHYCTMSRLTKVNAFNDPVTNAVLADSVKLTLEHDTVDVANPQYADYNPAAGDLTAADTAVGWKPAPVKTLIANLGGFVSKKYTIDDDPATYPTGTASKLMLGAFPSYTPTEEVADGILYMKAQYGLDTTLPFPKGNGDAVKGDGVVDEWTSSLADITDAGGRIYYNRILAVRVGVVARSPLLEKDPVVLKDSAGADITALPVLPAMLDSGGANIGAAVTWNIPDTHYRYKVYYTIIPFKNALWTP